GIEEAGGAFVDAEFANEGGDDIGVEHDVHGVEHPAGASGDQGAALGGRGVAGPIEEPEGTRRIVRGGGRGGIGGWRCVGIRHGGECSEFPRLAMRKISATRTGGGGSGGESGLSPVL